jgi:hypothetical protein
MPFPNFMARLFFVPGGKRSAWQVIRWWEARRLAYNAIMLAAGIVALLCFIGIDALPPRLPYVDLVWSPVLSVIFFAIAANIAYTSGWVIELILRRALPNDASAVGPRLLKAGLGFSLVITCVPPAVDFGVWLIRVLR